MAKAIPEELVLGSNKAFSTGRQLIEIVTNGMYSNPLMILREYIQNAADSIDEAVASGILSPEEGHIDVSIEGAQRTITILDNGAGVAEERATSVLASLGISTKELGDSRGFRGVGRLSGIGYSDRVQFETRAPGATEVLTIIWDCKKLKMGLRHSEMSKDIASLLKTSITMSSRQPKSGEEGHFFRVTLYGVLRFHKDELLDVVAASNYLCQTAPVPFDRGSFPFAAEVEQYFSRLPNYKCYQITLNGKVLHKPYICSFSPSRNIKDAIGGIETFDLKGANGDLIGLGWFARTKYLAALSPNVTMRGIRIRQGNIQVGDEHFLEWAFNERRFAVWHIGEIELSYKLKLNARRDGFEQTQYYEDFLERMASLGRYLSQLCRTSSKQRSSAISLSRRMEALEELLNTRFAVDEKHMNEMKLAATQLIRSLDKENGRISEIPEVAERYENAKRILPFFTSMTPYLLDALDGRALRHKTQKDLLIDVASLLSEYGKKSIRRESLIEAVLRPYLRKSVIGKRSDG